MDKMDALLCSAPGTLGVVQLEAATRAAGEVLVRPRRVGICGTDYHIFEGKHPFLAYPRVMGHELAVEVVDGGDSDFRPGEIVVVNPYLSCGSCIACRRGKPNCCTQIQVCGVHTDGGMAEYLQIPSRLLVHGEGLSYDELALVEPLAIGAHGVRRADVQPGEFVLVIGAGPIGLGIMEFARIAGAKVIAIDINEQRLDFCKTKLKVDYTINALSDDVTGQLQQITNNDMPTVVIDATGSQAAINSAFQYMAHTARFVLIGLQKGEISFSHPEFHKREATLMSSRNATREDFEHVIDSMKKGLVDPKVYITHRTSFDQISAEFESWLDPNSAVIKAMASF